MIELEAFPPGPMLERRADLWRDLRLRLAEGPPITFPTNDHLRRDMTAYAATEIPTFICPRCGAKSYNANDIAHRYCGRCHVFVDDEIRRDLQEGGLPMVERVDDVPPIQGTDVFDEARAHPPMFFFRDDTLDEIEHWQHDDAYRRARDANLAVLLATRADQTGGEPPDWRPEVLWCWRYLALRAMHEALFIGKARGGFSPSPVRWVIVCWAEPEPRRSRMLGLPAPWRPRVEPLATPWGAN